MLHFKLLGTAAGGGVPQWNCACPMCALCRQHTQKVVPRLQLQAAVWSRSDEVFLLNASPDLRFQIEANPELHPAGGQSYRNTPIRGIVLTTADLDQTLGLLLLREFQPLVVYCTARVRRALEANSFFRMLERVPDQLTWIEIHAGVAFSLGESDIVCTPIALRGEMPYWAKQWGPAEPGEASLGLLFEHDGKRLAYTPSLPEIDASLCAIYKSCEAILVDGTFWTDTELSDIHPGTPLARSIGHVPMSGAGSTLASLAHLDVPHKLFVHLNNTNPVLDSWGPEHRAVNDAGWLVGYDGWQLAL